MTEIEVIYQLEDLIRDRQSFLADDDNAEWNEIWQKDIDALKTAIRLIKKMTELRPCRYCKGKAKQYTKEGRNYIGEECFVSTCYCMMCGMQVEAFDESPIKAEEKAVDWWNRGIYDRR